MALGGVGLNHLAAIWDLLSGEQKTLNQNRIYQNRWRPEGKGLAVDLDKSVGVALEVITEMLVRINYQITSDVLIIITLASSW